MHVQVRAGVMYKGLFGSYFRILEVYISYYRYVVLNSILFLYMLLDFILNVVFF
jgi:hypothetical protein